MTSDDDDSTIEEQEAFELLNSVNENELCELRLDAETEICALLRDNYPGVLTEYNDFHDLDDYLDVSDEEDDDNDLSQNAIPLWPHGRPRRDATTCDDQR